MTEEKVNPAPTPGRYTQTNAVRRRDPGIKGQGVSVIRAGEGVIDYFDIEVVEVNSLGRDIRGKIKFGDGDDEWHPYSTSLAQWGKSEWERDSQ